MLLMLHGKDRFCSDCATVTIFLPVGDPVTAHGDQEWICTACDGAVTIPCLAA